MKLKKTQRALGVNPDPDLYEDVETKNGWYRKKKRTKKAKLNKVMTAYKDAMQYSSPAAKRILLKLEPWLENMPIGIVNAKISGGLRKSFVETGKMNFANLKDLDISEQKLDRTFESYMTEVKKKEVVITLTIGRNSIKLVQTMHTHFKLEAIIVWGDPMKNNGLRVDSLETKEYTRKMGAHVTDKLVIDLPAKKEPWMVLLKVGCRADDITEMTPKYYAMKVVAVGEG
jgi:hypothetical protein